MCSTKSNLSQHPKKSESHVRKTVIRKKKKNHSHHHHHHHQRQRKKFLIMSPATSTRWCPTAEQLMILEEMYKGGIRTPNASQIQQITAHLSFYGKIEGKNVFYWFQNHKARDRQKLRRKLTRQQQQHHHHLILHPHHINYQTSGASSSSSPSAAGFQQFPSPQYNSPNQFLLPQEGVLLQEEPPSHQVMNYTSWKVDNISQNKEDMEKSTRMMYGCDWMMMMDMVPTNFPHFTSTTTTTRPVLKTLELFPVKSTNLKDECTTSKHFSCSTNSTK